MLIGIICFFAGMLVLGTVVFFVLLHNLLKSLQDSVRQLGENFATLGRVLPEMLGESKAVNVRFTSMLEESGSVNKKATSLFAELLEQVKLLKASFETFTSLMWRQTGDEQPENAQSHRPLPRRPSEEGTFIPYDEVKSATEEAHAQARRHGVELDEARIFQPERSQMRGPDESAKPNQPEAHGAIPSAQDSGLAP